jgi:IS1 family transposase
MPITKIGKLLTKNKCLSMNKLSLEKRTQIISLLVEGNSLRSASRISDCSITTVSKLLVDVGNACQKFHDETVKNVTAKRVQCDEIWAFVYSKAKNVPENKTGEAGDIWTWVGLDADSKLVISWLVGNRDADSANIFMKDVANRLANRVQLTTDGLRAYLEAVDNAFDFKVDYAQLVKLYGQDSLKGEKKYSPAECIGCKKNKVVGNPDPNHISTSYIERQNLTMRMQMRRFTRLTNGFSKKLENHCHAVALNFVYYNFVRIHKTLRVTPAMEAGLTKELWNIEDIVKLTDKY